ncbi:MAG: hypothetical protein Q7T33_04510 [Dehalococcoidia bacterium]|nr:hypothetical protein [Dehalococcoidia bacterium]
MLRQFDDLYIPQDERTLQRIQRRADEIDRRVRNWAQSVVNVLPRGLSLHEDEVYILSLFLAQQRRLNLEMDSLNPPVTLRTRLGRVLPLVGEAEEDPELLRAFHRIVSTRLESDIDRACGFFCRDQNVPPISDPAIDWRVAIRFMAQSLHSLANQIDMRQYGSSPRRFELAVLARDLAPAVVDKRRALLAAFSTDPVL